MKKLTIALVAVVVSVTGAFAGTFVLTLSNPATIFSFIAIFGAMGGRLGSASPWTMIAGVLVGSALWWGSYVGA